MRATWAANETIPRWRDRLSSLRVIPILVIAIQWDKCRVGSLQLLSAIQRGLHRIGAECSYESLGGFMGGPELVADGGVGGWIWRILRSDGVEVLQQTGKALHLGVEILG